VFLLCELARGSMGENRASCESILGGSVSEEACCAIDSFLSFTQNIVYLHNICAEKLKYVHTEALGYNKCMNGAKKYAC
jgi:hypothetical protein